jgi:hypothetical protein
MRRRVLYAMIWLVISVAAGAVGHWLFGLSIAVASAIALGALVVNGLVIAWEDRHHGL